MCDVCRRLTENHAHSQLAADYNGTEVELVRDNEEVKLIASYWNAMYHNWLDCTIGFCPYCGEKLIKTAKRSVGAKDKNGRELYEGDCVKTKYGRICKIIWFESDQHRCWDLMPVDLFECKAPDNWDMWYFENLEFVR